MPACRSCRAPVFFVRSAATGRNMILNAEPDPAGNILIAEDLLGHPVAHVLGSSGDGGGDLYLDHHATCPNAEEWR